jgi:hypothetical protein
MRILGVLSIAGLVVLGGCSDSSGAPAATPSADASSSPSSAASSASGPQVDCAGIEEARRSLTEATDAELSRLGIDRGDPRAFQVTLLVTGREAAQYWTAVRNAVPAEEAGLRADGDALVAYWSRLDPDLDAIEIADGGEGALTAAIQRFTEISAAQPDEAVGPTQERLTAAVDASCGDLADAP